jgi:cell division protein DivIC
MKLFKNIHVPVWLKNKYFLTALVFTVWLLFFDDRDIITTHFKYRNELKQLEKSRDYYLQQIDTTEKELEGLKVSPEKLEKYAREKYLMKKDNEDLFISPE